MYFTVEEENLICLYHNADRRRTAANLRAALPDMDKEMAALACQTVNKQNAGRGGCQSLCVRRFFFATKHKSKPACLFISKLGRITMLIGIIMIQIAPKFF